LKAPSEKDSVTQLYRFSIKWIHIMSFIADSLSRVQPSATIAATQKAR